MASRRSVDSRDRAAAMPCGTGRWPRPAPAHCAAAMVSGRMPPLWKETATPPAPPPPIRTPHGAPARMRSLWWPRWRLRDD